MKLIRILIGISLLATGLGLGLLLTRQPANPPFESLSPAGMQKRVVAERDFGIQRAVAKGDYRCCIKPPCTMCYMEANPWNYFQAGTCACDDLIAKGEEPCPQCTEGLCEEKGEAGSCEVNLE